MTEVIIYAFYSINAANQSKENRVFCSSECRSEHAAKFSFHENSALYLNLIIEKNGDMLKCDSCGKEF